MTAPALNAVAASSPPKTNRRMQRCTHASTEAMGRHINANVGRPPTDHTMQNGTRPNSALSNAGMAHLHNDRRQTMKRSMLGIAIGTALAASAGLVQADTVGVTVGTLECHEASGGGLIFSSSRDLSCTFSGFDKDAQAVHYTGKINRYGVDIGFQQNAVILWGVVSTSNKFSPGDLAGKYGGLTAQIGWGGGLGANVLFGGSDNGFALQPISIQGFNGINLAAGVAEMELHPAS